MPSYILRQIDPDFWAAVKARAAREGRSLRGLVLLLLHQYVERGADADAPHMTQEPVSCVKREEGGTSDFQRLERGISPAWSIRRVRRRLA